MKTYVTFGQGDTHRINNKTFNKDCVAVIEAVDAVEGHRIVETNFGREYFTSYPEKSFNHDSMQFFPRGFIELN